MRRALQASLVSSHHAPQAVLSVLPLLRGFRGLQKGAVCEIPASGNFATRRDFCFSVCQASYYYIHLLASFWNFVFAFHSVIPHLPPLMVFLSFTSLDLPTSIQHF